MTLNEFKNWLTQLIVDKKGALPSFEGGINVFENDRLGFFVKY